MAQKLMESPLVPKIFRLLQIILIISLCIQDSPSVLTGQNPKLLNITIAIQNGGIVLANTTALVDYTMSTTIHSSANTLKNDLPNASLIKKIIITYMADGELSFHTWITSEDASSWYSEEGMLIPNRTVQRRNQSTDEVQGILNESDTPYNQSRVLRAPYWVKIAADVVHTINKCVVVTLACIVVADMGYHYIMRVQKTPRHHLRENL